MERRGRFRVRREPEALAISFPWRTPAAFLAIPVIGAMLAGVAFLCARAVARGDLVAACAGAPLLLAIAAIAWPLLRVLVNSTHIEATPACITIRKGPLPCRGAHRMVATETISRLHVIRTRMGRGPYTAVTAELGDGRRIVLLDELSSATDAEWIAAELAERCGLPRTRD
jgi:hypothetical protein